MSCVLHFSKTLCKAVWGLLAVQHILLDMKCPKHSGRQHIPPGVADVDRRLLALLAQVKYFTGAWHDKQSCEGLRCTGSTVAHIISTCNIEGWWSFSTSLSSASARNWGDGATRCISYLYLMAWRTFQQTLLDENPPFLSQLLEPYPKVQQAVIPAICCLQRLAGASAHLNYQSDVFGPCPGLTRSLMDST